MSILIDFTVRNFWLILPLILLILPFLVLLIRKMIHSIKLLGFYPRPARRPAWSRQNLSTKEAMAYLQTEAKAQVVNERAHSWIIDRLHWQIYMGLQTLRRRLSRAPADIIGLVPASQWFFDNYNLFYKTLMQLQEFGNLRKYRKMPILVSEHGRGYPRAYILAREIISCSNYHLRESVVLDMINAWQEVHAIKIRELWALPDLLILALLEKVVDESREIIRIIKVKQQAERTARHLASRIGQDDKAIVAMLRKECGQSRLRDRIFVSHLFFRLKAMSVNETEIAGWLARAQGIAIEVYTNILQDLINQEEQYEAAAESSIRALATSLKVIGDINWDDELPQVSSVDLLLSEDPAGVFTHMNSQTRGLYRRAVEKLARRYKLTENEVARRVLRMASSPPTEHDFPTPEHVGTYLTGDGGSWFARVLGGRNITPQAGRIRCKQCPFIFYYTGIVLFTIGLMIAGLALASRDPSATTARLGILAGLMILPVISISTRLMQDISAYLIKPRAQMAMDFHEGIPDDCRTFVVMPVIFNSTTQVRDYVDRLEKHYLANRQKNLYFALLGDFKDAPAQTLPIDAVLIDAAETAIHQLNARYPHINSRFFLLYRTRCWNPSESCWMGWERKRGKLEEFNALLVGDPDSNYILQVGDKGIFADIRYVITLDADTELIRESAATMVGIMAHPLNKPRIDEQKNRIVDGYAIVQPEIRNRIPKPSASVFTQFFSGQTGIDPYATVVSDVYQDVFREGIFVGKGIYDVQAMYRLLNGTIPENSVLSHDLLEGSLSRCAFASGVKLMDTPPSGIISFTRREHRWIRGDWQLLPWLAQPSPINWLSRWKILDNLRRSLIQPVSLALILFNALALPAIPWLWALVLCFDTAYSIANILLRIIIQKNRNPSLRLAFSATWRNLVNYLLQLLIVIMLIPFRAYLALDAIIRTLFRLVISHRKLLEWQTAESIERGTKNTLAFHLRTMWMAPLPGLILSLGLVWLSSWMNLMWGGLPLVALLWICSPVLSWLASLQVKPVVPGRRKAEQMRRLRLSARRTWNYFEDFSVSARHWLCPDNFQKYPGPRITDKTSPTNIGLQLLSTLAARDLGYIGLQAFIDKCDQIMGIVQKLPKWHGHLYNWYQISSIRILDPQYVSTVDSGNFCAHLLALKHGLVDLKGKPVFMPASITGMLDTLSAAGLDAGQILQEYPTLDAWAASLGNLQNNVPGTPTDQAWKKRIALLCGSLQADLQITGDNGDWAKQKTLGQIAAAGHAIASDLVARIDDLADVIDRIIRDTDFRQLYDQKHRLFIIGYHVSAQTPDSGRYDLMASEARLTSFLAIAKGDVTQRHWFALGRPFTLIRGTPALLSWSGSMFEYLMPNLVLKTPPGSIFSQSCHAAVTRQIIHGRKLKLPWGVSESQYYAFDVNSNYQYTSFGVMRLRLQSSLRPAQVITPYATCLSLTVQPRQALENIDRLRRIGAEGEYGFYEALDFNRPDSANLRQFSLVQSVMVHHLGMSLTAIDNFLNANIMQSRFHQEPMVQATEILLEETGAVGLIAVSRRWYTININTTEIPEEKMESRYCLGVDAREPTAHVLANQHYMLMLTADGEGFSKCGDIMINRWRPDVHGVGYGSFIYLRNLDNGQVWSSAYRPTKKEPDSYQVVFSPDKAEFNRRDGTINTRTEVTLSPHDNLELRRVTLSNNGDKAVTIEVTSYLEVVADAYLAEVAHPAFNKLFIETEYLSERNLLIARRRQRSPNDRSSFVMQMIRTDAVLKQEVEYEIDRRIFIGRNGSLLRPQALEVTKPLSCRDGFALDPILSLRAAITIPAGHSASLVFVTGYAASRDAILQMDRNFGKVHDADDLFRLSLSSSKLKMKYLSITPSQLNAIQDLVGPLYYPDLSWRGSAESLLRNRKGQSCLWKFGISGDNPIMLLRVADLKDSSLINDVLLAFEVLRAHHVQVDLVIFNDEETGYAMELNHLILAMISRLKIFNEGQDRPCLFIVNRYQLDPDEIDLLMTVARLVFTADTGIYFRNLKTRVAAPLEKPAERIAPAVIQLPSGPSGDYGPPIEAPAKSDLKLEFFNGIGGFTREGREYAIQIRNGMKPPAPWINVIANESFGFLVSESGAGYTWAKNSRENKLTTWYNDPVLDPVPEAIYIRDEVTGAITSPCLLESGYGGDYQVRHGFGYSIFEHDELGLRQTLTLFSAIDSPAKIWLLRLSSHGQSSGRFTVTLYVEWLLGVTRDQTMPYVITAFDEENECLTARNPYQDLYRDNQAILFSSEKIAAYTGDRQEFLGSCVSVRYPHGLSKSGLSGHTGAGLDPCGAIQVRVDLKSGETRTLAFGMGYADSPEQVADLARRLRSVEAAGKELATARRFWENKLGNVTVRTPDRAMDILMNGWLRYQVLSCRILARAAFYQCGGAYGFRDQLQDVLAFLDDDPELVRRQILLCCSRQYPEGDVQHWWHPPTGIGVRTRISDDLLWLPFVTAEYLQHTGDYAILEESAPFLVGDLLQPDQHEVMSTPQILDQPATVYRHCLLAIDHACRFGHNGLPLMGGGDWNDGMNEVGSKGIGESVWLGWFLYTVLHRFAPICKHQHDGPNQRRLASLAANLTGNLENRAWDGQWYLRAFFDSGAPMGSSGNEECQIDSISQSWAVLSEAGDPQRAAIAIESARRLLVREEQRAILLLAPPFDKGTDNPGYIRGYYPGVRENGGQYTHGAVWLAMAFAKLKKAPEAWQLISLLNPIRASSSLQNAYRYEKEPYIMAADISMANPYQGRAGWSWYTGSAGWMYQALLRSILGIHREGSTIVLDPCVPASFREYQVGYRLGETLYQISFKNKTSPGTFVQSLTVDGKPVEGNRFHLTDDGKTHQVNVILTDRKQ